MTNLDELVKVFLGKPNEYTAVKDRVAAVVRALRDDFDKTMHRDDDWNNQGIKFLFNEILGDANV